MAQPAFFKPAIFLLLVATIAQLACGLLPNVQPATRIGRSHAAAVRGGKSHTHGGRALLMQTGMNDEERPKAKKPLGAITVAKQLSRMKEKEPLETAVLFARIIKNAFLFTPIENFPLLLSDIGVLVSVRLAVDMLLIPSPYMEIGNYPQVLEAGVTAWLSPTVAWTHALQTCADGMSVGFYWVLAVLMGKGAAVSHNAVSNHSESTSVTVQTFAVTIILRLAGLLAQSSLLGQDLDVALLVVEPVSMLASMAVWRAIFTQVTIWRDESRD